MAFHLQENVFLVSYFSFFDFYDLLLPAEILSQWIYFI